MTAVDYADDFAEVTESEIRSLFNEADYVAGDDIVTTVLLTLRLNKPLLVEGMPGSGKTELAKVLSNGFNTELIRLQCYEGLAAESALYEWNYAKQLLSVQSDNSSVESEPSSVFSEEFLLERPLLRALDHDRSPPVLLIDEIDRADEEFEAFLLEVLSDYQVSIPELGTVEASVPPIVVITSNRTRGLSDALKRRCLYLYVTPPTFDKEYEIVRRKIPELNSAVAAEVCGAVQRLRDEPLLRDPGVAETLDWARAISTLRNEADEVDELSERELRSTLGCLLKEVEDIERIDDDILKTLRQAAREARRERT